MCLSLCVYALGVVVSLPWLPKGDLFIDRFLHVHVWRCVAGEREREREREGREGRERERGRVGIPVGSTSLIFIISHVSSFSISSSFILTRYGFPCNERPTSSTDRT